MKAAVIVFFCALFALLAGCVNSFDNNTGQGATLVIHGSGEIELAFCKRSWQGMVTPHGFGGYEYIVYKAALIGEGPIFSDPPFQDNPPDFHCFGTITLDREHREVTVNMRRGLSKKGEKTRPHPANGTYRVTSERDANAMETEYFRNWLIHKSK